MASEPLMAVLLIGLGYWQLSVAPPPRLRIPWRGGQLPRAGCQAAASAAQAARRAQDVHAPVRASVGPFIDLRLLESA
jgi:signal transduction protein with GAF and PtsI domain